MEVLEGDMAAPQSLGRALAGVTVVYLVRQALLATHCHAPIRLEGDLGVTAHQQLRRTNPAKGYVASLSGRCGEVRLDDIERHMSN